MAKESAPEALCTPRLAIYSPRFDPPEFPGLTKWTAAVCYHNEWRVRPDGDVDDLIAEANYMWAKCLSYYPDITSRAHIASLFRSAFNNQISKLNQKRNHRPHFSATDLVPDKDLMAAFKGSYGGIAEADLILDLEGAPAKVLETIRGILNGAKQSSRADCPTADGWKAANDFLCRLAGVPPETNLVGALAGTYRTRFKS